MLRRRIFNFFCCTLVLLIGQAIATAQINPIQGVHYRYEVIAASNPNLELYGAPSINDMGDVAFAGKLNGGGAVFIGDGPGSYWQLLPNFNQSNHIFGGTVVINNQKQVIAHETVTGTSPLVNILRLIDGNTTNSSTIIAAANLYQYDDYDQLYPTGLSLNDDYNEVGWVGRLGQQTTILGTGVRPNFNERGLRSTGGTPRPVRSVTGYTVTRVGNLATDDLMVYYPDMTPCCRVAGAADGFTAVGQSPGISDGGEAIVFYGVLSEAGAQAVGLTAGPGIFAAVEIAPEQRQLFRLTGRLVENNSATGGNDDGVCDTGETCQPGELGFTQAGQPVTYNSFDTIERVDVGYEAAGLPGIQDDVITVSYLGTPSTANDTSGQTFSNQKGLWTLTATMKLEGGELRVKPARHVPVVQVGDTIENQAVTDILVFDQIGDNNSRAAFTAITGSGRMIVRAETDKTPVIFVPGIGGSRFVAKDNTELWLNLNVVGINTVNHERLTLDPDQSPETLKVPGAVMRAKVNGLPIPSAPLAAFDKGNVYESIVNQLKNEGYDEYVVTDENQRTTSGCDENQRPNKPTLFVFAYDWRRTNAANAEKLRDYIGCVQKLHGPNTKVSIVAHSQGGLLTRRYILDNVGTHSVEKVVTIGSPWLGAPRAIEVLKNGNFIEPGVDKEVVKRIVPFFTGMHELFPSKLYDERANSINYRSDYGPAFSEQGWDVNENGTAIEQYSHGQLIDWLNVQNSRAPSADIPLLGNATKIFHDDNVLQDDWRSDTSGVKYFHIYGQQSTRDTTVRVFAGVRQCDTLDILNGCRPGELYYDVIKGKGDGTVPTISAERWESPYYDRNQPKNDFFLPGTGYIEDQLVEHNGLTRNKVVQDAVIAFLKDGKLPEALASLSQERATSVAAKRKGTIKQMEANHSTTQTSEPVERPAYYAKVFGVDFVEVIDQDNNSNNDPNNNPLGFVPGISYSSLGRAAQLITATTERSYTLKFKVGNEPLLLEILKGIGNVRPMEAVRYRDLNLPLNVYAKLELSPKGVSNLRYDRDGDGVFETVVQPTAHLSGTAALDMTPPTIQVNEVTQPVRQLVINATDTETGVRQVMYSFDGKHYEKYLAPIPLSLAQAGVLYVLADDNAANRSLPPVRYQFVALPLP